MDTWIGYRISTVLAIQPRIRATLYVTVYIAKEQKSLHRQLFHHSNLNLAENGLRTIRTST